MISVRDGTSNNLFEDNEIHSTSQGFSIGQGSVGKGGPHHNTFKNNRIFADFNAVFLHVNSSDNTFTKNLIVANEGAVRLESNSGSNNQLLDNTIYSQNNRAFVTNGTAPLRFRNNIFYSMNNVTLDSSNKSIDSDYNLFYRHGGGDLSRYLGTLFGSLEPYQKASNGDLNSISADPLLVDIQNNDFRPTAESPVCGAGEDGVDIGAFPCSGAPSNTQ